jgi:SH3-like domain-containing protein
MPTGWCGSGSPGTTPQDVVALNDAWTVLMRTTQAEPCDVGGWVTDPDPAGLNVRDAPSTNGAVLRTLPTDYGVKVVASHGAWVFICEAWPHNPELPSVRVGGWVHTSKLGTGTSGDILGYSQLRANPDQSAPEVSRVDLEADIEVLTCKGDWWRGRYKGVEGWLDPRDACANMFTTCPGFPDLDDRVAKP